MLHPYTPSLQTTLHFPPNRSLQIPYLKQAPAKLIQLHPTSLSAPSDRSSITLRLSSSLRSELRAPSDRECSSSEGAAARRERDLQRTVLIILNTIDGPTSFAFPFTLFFAFLSFSFAAAAFFMCSSEGTRTYRSVEAGSGVTSEYSYLQE
jgi:hypothetical protein